MARKHWFCVWALRRPCIKPQTKADVTFLPLRYVAEWLQLQVEFKDGAAYLQPAELGDTPDTLTLPKGNSNANLAVGGDMLLWQDKIYFRYRMYIEGLACTANIVQWTPETEDFDPARPTPKYEILLPGDNYSHFNVWQILSRRQPLWKTYAMRKFRTAGCII